MKQKKKPTLGDILTLRFNKINHQYSVSIKKKALKNYGLTPKQFLNMKFIPQSKKRRKI